MERERRRIGDLYGPMSYELEKQGPLRDLQMQSATFLAEGVIKVHNKRNQSSHISKLQHFTSRKHLNLTGLESYVYARKKRLLNLAVKTSRHVDR